MLLRLGLRVNNQDRRFCVEEDALKACVILVLRINLYGYQAWAFFEDAVSDVRNATRDREASQVGAISECALTYAGNVIWDCNHRQHGATPEGASFDAGDRISSDRCRDD